MTEKEFLEKHNIELSREEILLAEEALERMKRAKDVHHGIAHIYNLLSCFDEFILSEDFKKIYPRPDLKVIFFSILCHDCWRSGKDPKGALELFWYTVLENFGAPRLFLKMARKYKINSLLKERVKYCIKKDGWFTLFPLKTIEAKIHKALDEWYHFSEGRMGIIERKFLLDRPLKSHYVRQAKLAMKMFVEPGTTSAHYFPWIENKIKIRKQIIIPRLWGEIREYENLLKLKASGSAEEYQKSFEIFKKKVLET